MRVQFGYLQATEPFMRHSLINSLKNGFSVSHLFQVNWNNSETVTGGWDE